MILLLLFKIKLTIVSTCMVAIKVNTTVIAQTLTPITKEIVSKATINQAKISINNGEIITLPAYLVDGNNYIRIRDLCKSLDFFVASAYDENNKMFVYFDTTVQYPKDEINDVLPPLTKNNVNVNVNKMMVACNANERYIDGFSLDDRTYFKLRDLSNMSIEAKTSATGKSVKYFTINFNQQTGVIEVNVKTDGVSIDKPTEPITQPTTKSTEPTTSTQSPANNGTYEGKPLPPLTAPPAIGSYPAKIFIDESKPVYISGYDDYGVYFERLHLNWDNLTAPYKGENIDTCTGYARGRFKEVNGFDSDGGGTYTLYDMKTNNPRINLITDVNGIVDRSILVWKEHVVFVEYIERDKNDNPVMIYVSESGYGNEYIINGDNGKVRVMGMQDIDSGFYGTFLGYVAPK